VTDRGPALRRILSHSGWLLGASGVATLLSVAQLAVVARFLGAESYGVLTVVITYTPTVSQFLDSRAWETAIAYVVKYREAHELQRARAVVKLCAMVDAVTGVAAVAGVAVTASWASAVLNASDSGPLMRLYAWSLLFSIPVGISSALLRIGNRFDWIAYHSVAAAGIRFVMVIVAAGMGGGIEMVLAAYVASTALSTAVLVLMARRAASALGIHRWSRAPLGLLKSEWRGLFAFLGTTNASALLKVFQRNGDVLLVGAILNPTAAGYVRAARSLTDLINVPVGPLYTASYPEFVTLWRHGNRERLREVAGRLTMFASAMALGGAGALLIGAPVVISLVLGADYMPAVPLVRWLAVAMALAVATSTWHPLLLAIEQPGRSLAAIGFGVTFQIAVLLVALPALGAQAAGVAYLAFYLIWIPVAGFGVTRGLRHA
jgi:O-antigen/teichoic acid export membrane protein